VLNTIGCQPPVTLEVLDKPTHEAVHNIYESVAEFAYELPVQQIKANVPPTIQPREVFQEALDLLVVHALSRQLAAINGIDDFCLRDFWEPQKKRLHSLLSGFINFCRYKESNNSIVSQMKEDVQRMEDQLLEAQDQLVSLEQKLAEASSRHTDEQPEVRMLESQVREARVLLEKQQKALQAAERTTEEKTAALEAQKRTTEDAEQRTKDARQVVADLQGEVAESPEGLEQEIQEFSVCIRQLKARLEDKANEKRSRGQRVQALTRLEGNVTRYSEDLDRAADMAAKSAHAQAKLSSAKDELTDLERSLEAAEGSRIELEQAVKQVTADLDRAKADHEQVLQTFETRREQALDQQREVQSKRTEELRRHEALVSQRVELEAEILEVQRAHEVEMGELQLQYRGLQEQAEGYLQDLVSATQRYDAGRDVCRDGGRAMGLSQSPQRGAAAAGGVKPWQIQMVATPGKSPRTPRAGLRC